MTKLKTLKIASFILIYLIVFNFYISIVHADAGEIINLSENELGTNNESGEIVENAENLPIDKDECISIDKNSASSIENAENLEDGEVQENYIQEESAPKESVKEDTALISDDEINADSDTEKKENSSNIEPAIYLRDTDKAEEMKERKAISDEDKIYFLRVGNSDCTIVQSNGQFGIIDASNAMNYGFWSNSTYNGASVAEFLEKIGVEQLDFAVITHNHSDHIGGFIDLAGEYNKGAGDGKIINENTTVYYKPYTRMLYEPISGDAAGNYFTAEYFEKAYSEIQGCGAKMVDVSELDADTVEFIFGDYTINLYNLAKAPEDSVYAENANSILTLISKGNISTAIMADAGYEYEATYAEVMRDKVGDGSIFVLRNAHHGITSNSTVQCVEILNPVAVIASKDYETKKFTGNFYYYRENNIPYFSTSYATRAYILDVTDNIFYGIETFENDSLTSTVSASQSIEVARGWVKIMDMDAVNHTRWMFVNDDDSLAEGWKKSPENGRWYYLDVDNCCAMLRDTWLTDKNKLYHFATGGSMDTGWNKIDGIWYHFQPSGYAERGWRKEKETWYYLDRETCKMCTYWEKIDGKWYYFSTTGAMQKGWVKSGDSWYYMNSSGAMATGWKKVNNNWYYMNSSGAMATGWKKINDNWYYLDGSGAMQTGWKQINGNWYYLSSSGALV